MSADILIVDDEADIRMLLSGILEDEGYRVRTAHGDAEARRQVGLARPDLIFQDIWLQGSTADGIGLLEEYAQNIKHACRDDVRSRDDRNSRASDQTGCL